MRCSALAAAGGVLASADTVADACGFSPSTREGGCVGAGVIGGDDVAGCATAEAEAPSTMPVAVGTTGWANGSVWA